MRYFHKLVCSTSSFLLPCWTRNRYRLLVNFFFFTPLISPSKFCRHLPLMYFPGMVHLRIILTHVVYLYIYYPPCKIGMLVQYLGLKQGSRITIRSDFILNQIDA